MTRICQNCYTGDIVDGECNLCGHAPAQHTPKRQAEAPDTAFWVCILVSFLFALIVCGAGLYRALT